MSKFRQQTYRGIFRLVMTASLITLTTIGCKKYETTPVDEGQATAESASFSRGGHGGDLKDFLQVNLVANQDWYHAAHMDTALKNAWGLSWSTTGIAWIGSEEGHVSNVYNGEGVTLLGPVKIPAPTTATGGSPTGVVTNPAPATDFKITSGNGSPDAGARFMFVGTDGVVSAWNPTWGTGSFRKFNNSATAVYTGATIANNNGVNCLYAANFRARRIDVWDANWNPVSLPFNPHTYLVDYAPFNIQNIGGMLYVMYAKVGSDGEEQTGVGKGFVNVYTTAGVFVKRFAERDKLNAPWGIAMASAAFFPDDMRWDDGDDNSKHGDEGNSDHHNQEPAILVGNFGDGKINGYTLNGRFLGQLRKERHTLVIDGLWSIGFAPTTSTVDQRRLYFTAGPRDEQDGLFGYIIKDSTSHH